MFSIPLLYPEHLDLTYYLDDNGYRQPVDSKESWAIRRAHILHHMQSVMGPVPDASRRVPLEPKILETTKLSTLTRHKVEYQTEPDTRVRAYLFLPEKVAGKPAAAVLCLHQTTRIGKEEPAGLGGNPNLHYALHLAQRGYVTLAPDYPSFGEYAYDFAPAHGYVSGSMKAIWDNMRALDYLETLPEVDRQRIGCIGHSLGGHNTLFTSVFDQRIRALVSNCGFTRFHRYYNGRLAGWTSNRYMPRIANVHGNSPDRVPFDFPEIIAALAPRAFLASSPTHDDNFEVSGVVETMSAARPIYDLFGATNKLRANYPDCAHDFPQPVRDVAYALLDEFLKV